MSLQISRLAKDGDASQEYLLLQATADINLNDYAVVDKTFDEEGKPSNVMRHFFRFPKKEIKKGEYVSLRTGKGNSELGKTKQGEIVHRIYWGSDAPIWNDANRECAEVLKVETLAKTATGNEPPAKHPTVRKLKRP